MVTSQSSPSVGVMEPSDYVAVFLDWMKHGFGSAILDAVSGSGKTTALEQASALIPPNKKAIFLAFNKKIALELAERLPSHVESKTLNSFGYHVLKRYNRNLIMDEYKTQKILEKEFEYPDYYGAGKQICDMVSKAKIHGYVPTDDFYGWVLTTKLWRKLIKQYEIDIKLEDSVIEPLAKIANRILLLSLTKYKNKADYNDQLYMPVTLELSVPVFDWVFVDEAQDISSIQRMLLKRIVRSKGRFVAVGDKNQSVYEFRGADHHSMDRLKRMFDCQTFPLSVSYRCPLSVVRLAQTLVPEIQARPNAPEGSVSTCDFKMADLKVGDFVLCRNNAPLIKAAIKISEQQPCYIEGGDLPKNLIKIIREQGVTRLSDLTLELDNWYQKKVKVETEFDRLATMAGIRDKYKSIKMLIDKYPDINTAHELIGVINTLFTKTEGVMLSTAHQSKGLEANNVFIIKPELFADTQQDRNLRYVAYTRAKKNLYLVQSLI